MPCLLWDASAIAKRYVPETGSPTVDELFQQTLFWKMFISVAGYSETYAILSRRRNSGMLSTMTHAVAQSALRAEIIDGDFELISIDDNTIFASLPLIDQHNLNSSDAAILASYLVLSASLPEADLPTVLVASDQRLLRAAQAEGLAILNPELVAPTNVASTLATFV